MELLVRSRRRNILSEVIYVLLNIAAAVVTLIIVLAVDSPIPAFVLVLLSKWRVLAVRPQYWIAHIKANAVDIIVSLSFVILLYAASGAFIVQAVLTLLYIAWLLFLKPRSKRMLVVLQAAVGLFVGVSALAQVSYSWWSSAVVIVMWVIGYSVARHVLTAYKESHFEILSLLWGVVIAEIGWVTYHWSFAYDLKVTGNLMLSQAAIVTLLLSFMAERVYASYHTHKVVRTPDILLPVLISVSSIGLLLTVFGR